MSRPDFPPLIAIFGPTAAGKSALALAICQAFGGEIVTADSRQVYRYMDIGTDKPGPRQLSLVPHHMIDLVDPDESYTLALYQEQAISCINDILARGKLPVLAGGTPLYVNSIIEGWVIPKVEPDVALRASLEAEVAMSGPAALHERLRTMDPQAAATILPSNGRRIIRALEVIYMTGRPISEQQDKSAPPYRILPIYLESDRPVLYARIEARVDSYIARGLIEEVRSLNERGYAFDLPAMSGIGYRQIGDYLLGRASLEEAVQRIKWDTHAFVRHQGNWFRRAGAARRIDVTHGLDAKAVLDMVGDFLILPPADR